MLGCVGMDGLVYVADAPSTPPINRPPHLLIPSPHFSSLLTPPSLLTSLITITHPPPSCYQVALLKRQLEDDRRFLETRVGGLERELGEARTQAQAAELARVEVQQGLDRRIQVSSQSRH